MGRINLDELRAEEEVCNKKYVWEKPLKFNINKGRRATDSDIIINRDRRIGIERREFTYAEYIPERRGKIQRRKIGRDRRKS